MRRLDLKEEEDDTANSNPDVKCIDLFLARYDNSNSDSNGGGSSKQKPSVLGSVHN